jgi:hypothetical protein
MTSFLQILIVLTAFPLPPSVGRLFQDPIPTTTPEWVTAITLQPGAQLIIERSISYGDISVVVAIMALCFILLFTVYMLLPKIWKTR